jgi:hypothetical protein
MNGAAVAAKSMQEKSNIVEEIILTEGWVDAHEQSRIYCRWIYSLFTISFSSGVWSSKIGSSSR